MDNVDKNNEIDLVELSKAIWAKRRMVIKYMIIGAVVGVIVAFSIPKKYETVVKIAPESKNMSGGLASSMGSLAELAGMDIGGKQIDGISEKIYPEIVKSRPFLFELINIPVQYNGEQISFYDYITEEQKKPWWEYVISAPFRLIGVVSGLFSDDDQEEDKEFLLYEPTKKQLGYLNALNDAIVVSIDKKLGILSISTTMQDPKIAAVISDSILSNLQRYMTDYKTAKMRYDLDVNTKRMEEARAKYYSADSIYAVAVDKNQNLVSQVAKIKLDRSSNERTLAFNVYQQLASQVEISRVRLQESTPIATVIEPSSVAVNAMPPTRRMILVVFAFLGVVVAIGTIVVNQIMLNHE